MGAWSIKKCVAVTLCWALGMAVAINLVGYYTIKANDHADRARLEREQVCLSAPNATWSDSTCIIFKLK